MPGVSPYSATARRATTRRARCHPSRMALGGVGPRCPRLARSWVSLVGCGSLLCTHGTNATAHGSLGGAPGPLSSVALPGYFARVFTVWPPSLRTANEHCCRCFTWSPLSAALGSPLKSICTVARRSAAHPLTHYTTRTHTHTHHIPLLTVHCPPSFLRPSSALPPPFLRPSSALIPPRITSLSLLPSSSFPGTTVWTMATPPTSQYPPRTPPATTTYTRGTRIFV